MNLEQKETLRSWVDGNPMLTLGELREMVGSTYNLVVSKSTVDLCLRQFHYTLKQISIVPERRNDPSVIDKRASYAREFRILETSHNTQQFVFLDEVGFSVASRPKKGRSLVGTSAFSIVPAARTRNISVFAAMNRSGMIYNRIFDSPLNGERFVSCLSELQIKCIDLGLNDPVFILDNARIHHYSGVKEMITEGNIKLRYLPPYSPFLNPIENCFSVWKNFVIRGCAKTEVELQHLIQTGFLEVTESNCEAFFRKMLRYVIKSERDEVIFE